MDLLLGRSPIEVSGISVNCSVFELFNLLSSIVSGVGISARIAAKHKREVRLDIEVHRLGGLTYRVSAIKCALRQPE